MKKIVFIFFIFAIFISCKTAPPIQEFEDAQASAEETAMAAADTAAAAADLSDKINEIENIPEEIKEQAKELEEKAKAAAEQAAKTPAAIIKAEKAVERITAERDAAEQKYKTARNLLIVVFIILAGLVFLLIITRK